MNNIKTKGTIKVTKSADSETSVVEEIWEASSREFAIGGT